MKLGALLGVFLALLAMTACTPARGVPAPPHDHDRQSGSTEGAERDGPGDERWLQDFMAGMQAGSQAAKSDESAQPKHVHPESGTTTFRGAFASAYRGHRLQALLTTLASPPVDDRNPRLVWQRVDAELAVLDPPITRGAESWFGGFPSNDDLVAQILLLRREAALVEPNADANAVIHGLLTRFLPIVDAHQQRQRRFAEVVADLRAGALVPNADGVLRLPERLHGLTVDDVVLVERRQSRLVVLFRLWMGRGSDLDGVVLIDGGLTDADLVPSPWDRELELSIGGIDYMRVLFKFGESVWVSRRVD
jgi:hypothetical protein